MIGAGVLHFDADRVINSTAIKVKMHVRSGRKRADEKAIEKQGRKRGDKKANDCNTGNCNGGWQRDGSGLRLMQQGRLQTLDACRGLQQRTTVMVLLDQVPANR